MSLAGLIGNGAGGLAGRLTRCLALAAAALSRSFLKISLINCFDVFHKSISFRSFLIVLYHTASIFAIAKPIFYYSAIKFL